MNSSLYNITLHHLSPDARAIGTKHLDQELANVSLNDLRGLLVTMAKTGAKPSADDLAAPEIRIKTAKEVLRVRPSGGLLRLVSWDTKVGGMDFNVDQIIERLDGPLSESDSAARKAPQQAVIIDVAPSRLPKWVKIAGLSVVILAINATTIWFLLRPPPTLLAQYELLPDSDARRLLSQAAGEYETGNKEGDRRLIIQPDGSMILSTYGIKRKIIEETTLSSRGAETSGRPALLTSDPYLLEIKDVDTVILYGNAYKRRQS